MYRISKVLNHNTVIGIHADDNQEYLVMGRDRIRQKVSERFEVRDGDTVYSLQATSIVEMQKSSQLPSSPFTLRLQMKYWTKRKKCSKTLTVQSSSLWLIILEYAVKAHPESRTNQQPTHG